MAIQKSTLRSKKNALTLEELYLNEETRSKINQLLEEYIFRDALLDLSIPIDNKILLHGHTGCGKTATAHAIGIALNKKVITVNLSGFVSSKLGETAKNMADLFREAEIEKAILFIDEFDFIGKLRDYDEKDSGEMKRLVNALIQQIDHLSDDILLIAATNHVHIIDTALLRRFQLKLNYELPSQEGLDIYYDSILNGFPKEINTIDRIYGISYAEAKDLILQQIKANVIQWEKSKKHILFQYDQNAFSIDNRGEKMRVTLSGYKLNEHGLAIKSINKTGQIDGELVEVNGQELIRLDKTHLKESERILETTDSGVQVWLYIAHNS